MIADGQLINYIQMFGPEVFVCFQQHWFGSKLVLSRALFTLDEVD